MHRLGENAIYLIKIDFDIIKTNATFLTNKQLFRIKLDSGEKTSMKTFQRNRDMETTEM